MNKRTLLLSVAAACAAVAAAPAPASATVFCVPGYTAACPDNGINVAETDLEIAAATDAGDGIADTIMLAPGTTSEWDGFDITNEPDPLQIVGAGPQLSRLSTGNGSDASLVLNLAYGTRDVTLRDVAVVVPASAPPGAIGVEIDGDLLDNVDVIARSEGARGVEARPGGTVSNSRVYGSDGGSIAIGVKQAAFEPGTVTVERSSVASTGAGVLVDGPAAVVVRASRLDAGQGVAVSASSGGYVTATNSVMTTRGPRAVLASCEDDAGASIDLTHVTIAGDAGLGYGSAIEAQAEKTSKAGSCSVAMSSSIAHGFAKGYSRVAAGGTYGDANIRISHSDLPAGGISTGNGVLDVGATNIHADPLFAGPDDFHLRAGSPAIDQASPVASGLATDFDGAPRELDGDGDATARRDMGAYEFQPVAPEPTPSAPGGQASGAGDSPGVTPAGPGGAAGGASGGTTPPGTTPDRTAPKLRRLRVLRRGRALSLTLSEPATLRVRIKGRLVTLKGKAGTNRLTLKRRLPTGRHTLTVVAIDAAGNKSSTARLRTRI